MKIAPFVIGIAFLIKGLIFQYYNDSETTKNYTEIEVKDDKIIIPLNKNVKSEVDSLKSIIIGDSQTPFVDNASEKVSRISTTPGMSSLWQGGKTLTWLISAIEKYPTDITIGDVVFCIGTNGGYSSKDNVEKLITLTKEKFPNSKLYAVQGSWGWGGIKDVTETRVRTYYKRFEELGVTIIEPPIGKIEPHGNKPIYKVIGKELDSLL
jgi:hypothetical protein